MWKCAKCGVMNENNFCKQCGSMMENEAFDGSITIKYKIKEETISKEAQSAEKQKKKSVNKALVISVICAIFVVFTLILGALGFYFSAKSDLKNARFDSAVKKFEKISFLFDSKSMIKECSYLKAKDLIEKKEYDSAVSELFEILDYKDSVKVLQSCYISMIEVYKKSEDFKSASELISSIDKSLINDEILEYEQWCDYAYAKSLIQKEPEKALLLLTDCGMDYEDIEDLIFECHYLIAKEYIENGEYDLAYDEFEECIDYKDSEYLQSSLKLEIVKKAIEEYNNGDYEESVRLFEMSGDIGSEASDEVMAYKLFLSYKTNKYQRPAINNRLFSYVGSYMAAREIVLEDESVFKDFVKGKWESTDGSVYSFSNDFSVSGVVSGSCKLDGRVLSVKSGADYITLFKSIEIINENKIRVAMAGGENYTLSRAA